MNKADTQWQDQAEQAERSGASSDNPEVERYRLVLRALGKPTVAQLPADFARSVQLKVIGNERRAAFEDGLVTVLMLVMVIVGLAVAFPYIAPIVSTVGDSLPIAGSALSAADSALSNVPWKTILAASLSIAVAMAMERFFTRSAQLA